MKRTLHILCCIVLLLSGSLRLQAQSVATYAGNGTTGFSGDGGSAPGASFGAINRMAADMQGNLYIADHDNYRVRKVTPSGTVTTFAGGGTLDFTHNGVPATSAMLDAPTCVAVDKNGNVYIGSDALIRKVDTFGMITNVAGRDTLAGPIIYYSGLALDAYISGLSDLDVDKNGNVYFVDAMNYVVGKVDTLGMLSLFAGDGTSDPCINGSCGDGGPAVAAKLGNPQSVAADGLGNVYIADMYQIRKVDAAGIIHTVAGTTYNGFLNQDLINGNLNNIDIIREVAVDRYDNVYFTAGIDYGNLYELNTTGNLSTIGGSYNMCLPYSYQQSDADNTFLDSTCFSGNGLTIDNSGNIFYITYNTTASSFNQVRKITAAGNKISGFIPNICSTDTPALLSYKISLFTYDTTAGAMQCVDSTTTVTIQNVVYYNFINKPVGNYTLKAELLSAQPSLFTIVPTYSFTSVYWDSTFYWRHNIGLDAQTFVAMQVVPATTGTDTVSGNITSGEAKGTDAGIPVADMGVYLRDAAGTIIAYTLTNAGGDYMFTNVADGTYDIYPEAINYTTTPYSTVTLGGAQTSYTNALFRQHIGARTITPYDPTGIAEVAGVHIQVYPNPAADMLKITGLLAADDVKLVDINGKVVYAAGTGTQQSTVSINVKILAPGSYMLQIKDRAGYNKYSKAVVKN